MYTNIKPRFSGGDWFSYITQNDFETCAWAAFAHQYEHCDIYRQYVDALKIAPGKVEKTEQIPFLPISFFKTHKVTGGHFRPELVFESSGTTGMANSKHWVKDAGLYRQSFLNGFRQFYGQPSDYIFLCLLPSYLERGNSSLVYMADALIKMSGDEKSGFYLNEWASLAATLQSLRHGKKKVVLLGVTFALLDFAEKYPMDLGGAIVMETGGMKGRREEWTRAQVHRFLKDKWHLDAVHSEYGMTELLSQAYAHKDGIFAAAATMRVYVRDESDPFDVQPQGSGILNVIDLANIDACSFIATDDIAKIYADGSFEVLGRLDNSALRGCSLMVV
ncbi:MAG: acyl transferase [Edaphocola sp.]